MRFDGSRAIASACLALVVTASLACADFRRGPYWELDDEVSAGDESGTGGGEYGYADDVHAILDAGCERCHGVGNSAGDTDLVILPDDVEASYQSSLEFVDLDAPASSRLLSKMAGAAHGGGTIFDDRSPEYDLILTWIERGAPP